jgi:hypothetical protein
MTSVTLKVKSRTPQDRVLSIEACARAICEREGLDPPEAVMMLLTAAAHMALVYSDKPPGEISLTLAGALGNAIVAASDFFKLRPAD